jgi:predicted transcriptional regulator
VEVKKMKRVTVELDDELAKQLKILAINSNGTVKSYVTNLIKKDLQTKKDIRE